MLQITYVFDHKHINLFVIYPNEFNKLIKKKSFLLREQLFVDSFAVVSDFCIFTGISSGKIRFSSRVLTAISAKFYFSFLYFIFVFRHSETQRRLHVSERKDPQQPRPKCRPPRVRAPRRLPKVLRVSERHHPPGTRMFGRRSVQ